MHISSRSVANSLQISLGDVDDVRKRWGWVMNGNVQLTADDFRRMKAIEYAMQMCQRLGSDVTYVLAEAARIEAFLNGISQTQPQVATTNQIYTTTGSATGIWPGGYTQQPAPVAPNPARPIKKSLD